MSKYKLEIHSESKFRHRVVNANGDAELGNWHIADFAWLQHAEFFIEAWNLYHGKKTAIPTKGSDDA